MTATIIFAMLMQVNFSALHKPDVLPEEIRGAWDSSDQACQRDNSTSRVHLGINWIGFYESGGVLQISTPAGIPEFDKSLALRFVMAGEGSTWDNEIVVGWSGAKPNELTWIEAKSPETMNRERERGQWVRCSV